MTSQDKPAAGMTSFMTMTPDVRGMMETQRRNLQTMAEAGRMVMTNWQAMMQRQAEMASTFAQTQSEIFREGLKEGTPEEKIARQADMFKKAYEASVEQSRDMADMMMKANRETADMMQKRVRCTLNEMREMTKSADKAA
jgi:phasin family protein